MVLTSPRVELNEIWFVCFVFGVFHFTAPQLLSLHAPILNWFPSRKLSLSFHKLFDQNKTAGRKCSIVAFLPCRYFRQTWQFRKIHRRIVSGDINNKDEILDWIIDQKNDETVEEIDRETLFDYIGSKDFLAVVFCKSSLHQFSICANRNHFSWFVFRRSRRSGCTSSASTHWVNRWRSIRVWHHYRQNDWQINGEEVWLSQVAGPHVLPQRKEYKLRWWHRWRGGDSWLADTSSEHGNDRSHRARQSKDVSKNSTNFGLLGCIFL